MFYWFFLSNAAVFVAAPGIFHVHVVDAIGKLANKCYVIDSLISKVTGVVVETESFMLSQGGQRSCSRGRIEGNFGRVYFQREVYIDLLKHVEDR